MEIDVYVWGAVHYILHKMRNRVFLHVQVHTQKSCWFFFIYMFTKEFRIKKITDKFYNPEITLSLEDSDVSGNKNTCSKWTSLYY